MKLKLPYVLGFVDRHGKPRYYFRRAGHKRVALPGLPWSPEFTAAVATKRAWTAAAPMACVRRRAAV
jgi:hypothetical protein